MEFYLRLIFWRVCYRKRNFFSGVTICKYWPAKILPLSFWQRQDYFSSIALVSLTEFIATKAGSHDYFRFIDAKNSSLLFVFFILSSKNSIAARSSISDFLRIQTFEALLLTLEDLPPCSRPSYVNSGVNSFFSNSF